MSWQRRVLLEGRPDRATLPHEDAGVPGNPRRVLEDDGSRRLGLLFEGSQGIRGQLQPLPSVEVRNQVSVLGRRPVHPDTEGHEWIVEPELDRAGRQLFMRLGQDRAKERFVDHPVVRGKDEHDFIVVSVDRSGCERDRRSRVLGGRLDDESCSWNLALNEVAVAPIGDAEDVVGSDQILHPGDRPLDQRFVVDQGQEGLWAVRPAEGPQAGPATAGQDDNVHGHP